MEIEIDIEIPVDHVLIYGLDIDELFNSNLKEDLNNNNIFGGILISSGYVGNRPEIFYGEHPDDTWAIDLYVDGNCIIAYLYASEYEYNEDLNKLKEFA